MNRFSDNENFIKRLLIICATITLIVLLILATGYVIDVLMVVFASALLAIFLRGLADLINERLHISEGKAVLVVSLLLLAILAGSIALLAPNVAEQIRHLRDELPRSAENLSGYLSYYSWGRAIIEQLPSIDEVVDKINTTTFLSNVGGFFRRPPASSLIF